MRRIVVLAAVSLGLCAGQAQAAQPAPGAPGERHTWAPADKHGFGSAVGGSNVWFTLRSAELSEIYYPDLSTPAFRDLEFAVSDGRTVEFEKNARSKVEPIRGTLAFKQTTWGRRWKLEKTWITDPSRATVLADVRFKGKRGLRVYAIADPAPGDDGNDDRGAGMRAWDDTAASAVRADPPLRRATSGYAGTASDPRVQLSTRKRLKVYDATQPGNVVQGARVRFKRGRATLAIGFGADAAAARATANASLAGGFKRAARTYGAGWARYLAGVKRPPRSVGKHRRLYEQSVMVLEAMEDKLNPGASIASPSMPWVWGTLTLSGEEFSGPYHLVWPRDFYHVATAQQAAGDSAAAQRLMDYLWRVQKADGSWWQNTKVDGTEFWTSLQMDEVALPVVLAWWLNRRAPADWEHVRRAADFIVANGPESEQERWENQSGWSPNTIATEIAGLICAADIARANGDTARAAQYEATADEWRSKVEDWTATRNGPYSAKPYYLRVTKDGNPNDGSTYSLGDNFPRDVDEREIVDQSFLQLALFGIKAHDDPTIRNSLAVGDQRLKVGNLWYRFSYDGYGETATGADWDIFPTAERQTFGRLWPLLSGERGEYELLAGRPAGKYLDTIATAANDGLMLPEQVWDGRPGGGPVGEGTRAGTPLAWTHAQFIRLAWSIDAGRPIEQPRVVACRYLGGC